MDLEKGRILIDFDFQANPSFMDTLEFVTVLMLKEALDYMLHKEEITAAVIEIKKQVPLWIVVRRSVPVTPAPFSHIAHIAKLHLDFKKKLGEDLQLVFLEESLKS
jgi:hypothetical protein